MTNTKRKTWIDIAKGFGILLMIFGHCDHVGTIQRWLYSFHMPLFFILSGILFTYKNETRLTIKEFILRKVHGLLIPYFLLSFIYLGYMFVVGYSTLDIKSAAIHTFLLYGEGNFWFIPCLFISTILFFLFHRTKVIVPIIGAFGVLIIDVIYPLGQTQYSFITLLLKSVVGMLYIWIGTLLASFFNDVEHQKITKQATLCGIFFLANFLLYYWNGNTPVDLNTIRLNHSVLYFAAAISGAAACITLSIILQQNKLLEYFGRNSLYFLAGNNLSYFIDMINQSVRNYFPIINYTYVFWFWFCVTIFELILIGCISIFKRLWHYLILSHKKTVG